MPQRDPLWLGTGLSHVVGDVRKALLSARAAASRCHGPSGRMRRVTKQKTHSVKEDIWKFINIKLEPDETANEILSNYNSCFIEYIKQL